MTIRQTKRIKANLQQPAVLAEAAASLRAGGLVVFPTETVYGIGANAYDPEAVAAIFQAKGRPQDNPLIAHIAQTSDLTDLVRHVPEEAVRLMRRFWPGPLTLVLPKSDVVPAIVSAGLPTVAVRMPSHPVARQLISLAGVPVVAPSANLSGTPSPTTAAHCAADLMDKVDYIIDGGPCPLGLESTVLSLIPGQSPRLLRPGAVTPDDLREVLDRLEIDPAVLGRPDPDSTPMSPGMKYRHYAPAADIIMVHGSFPAFLRYLGQNGREGDFALVFDEERDLVPLPAVAYGPKDAPARQGELLFAALRELDRLGARRVFARPPERQGVGLAVYNRLIRAASYQEIELHG